MPVVVQDILGKSPPKRAITAMHFNCIFLFCDPLAVTGFIILPVANSADYVVRWARSHIGEKQGKVGSPPSADFDASATVPFKIVLLRAVTSSAHVQPDSVRPSLPVTRAVPMC